MRSKADLAVYTKSIDDFWLHGGFKTVVAPPRIKKSEVPILGPILKILEKVGDAGQLTGEWLRGQVVRAEPLGVAEFMTEMILGVPRELNELAGEAGDAVAQLIKGSGESLGTQALPFVRALQPGSVAMYLGSQLLTVVAREVAAIMLAGMKRNMRARIRVRG